MHWFSLLEVNRAGNVLVCLDTQRPTRMRLICDNWLVDWSKQTTSALVLVMGIGHCRGRLDLAVDRDHASDVICTCDDACIVCSPLTTCEVKKKELPCRPVENGHQPATRCLRL